MKKNLLVLSAFLSTLGLGVSAVQAGGCPSNCNGNGVCDGGTNTCICNVGFTGTGCEFCAPNYYSYPACVFCLASTTCSGNGTCSVAGFCNCNAGWLGVDCSIPSCPGSCGNGTCVAPNTCSCFPGWTGPNCDQQVAVPTVSEWGLAALTLTGLIAGTILFSRKLRTA